MDRPGDVEEQPTSHRQKPPELPVDVPLLCFRRFESAAVARGPHLPRPARTQPDKVGSPKNINIPTREGKTESTSSPCLPA